MTFSREPRSRARLADAHLRQQDDPVGHLQREQRHGGGHGECLRPGDRQLQQRRTHGHDLSHSLGRAAMQLHLRQELRPPESPPAATPPQLPATDRPGSSRAPLFCRGRRQPRRRRSRRDSQQHPPRERRHRRLRPQPAPGTGEPRHSRLWSCAIPTPTFPSTSAPLSPTPITPPSTSPCTRPPVVTACASTPRCCPSAATIAEPSAPGPPPSTLPCRSARPPPPPSPPNCRGGKSRFAHSDRAASPAQ